MRNGVFNLPDHLRLRLQSACLMSEMKVEIAGLVATDVLSDAMIFHMVCLGFLFRSPKRQHQEFLVLTLEEFMEYHVRLQALKQRKRD
jgi:hypothetical protein